MESVRDLERRIEEGEVARRAVDLRQSQVYESLRRLAQGQLDFGSQDVVERVVAPEVSLQRTRNGPLNVRHQLARTFHIERRVVATFNGRRRIARLKGAEYYDSRVYRRRNTRSEVILGGRHCEFRVSGGGQDLEVASERRWMIPFCLHARFVIVNHGVVQFDPVPFDGNN